MPNIKLKVAYDGSSFHGFARQKEKLTIQGNLEEALSIILREDIETVCAGRTDAGVHARSQVVNFFAPEGFNLDDSFAKSLNALTHGSICILEATIAQDDFSARFSAKSREYRYFIHNDKTQNVFSRNLSWHISTTLNVRAMKEASKYLIGERDFKSFCVKASSKDKTTIRNVMEISFDNVNFFDESLLQIKIVGNAFLHSMVRTIVGTLVLVGKEKRPPSWVKEVLSAKCRECAGETAPACGLIFWNVNY